MRLGGTVVTMTGNSAKAWRVVLVAAYDPTATLGSACASDPELADTNLSEFIRALMGSELVHVLQSGTVHQLDDEDPLGRVFDLSNARSTLGEEFAEIDLLRAVFSLAKITLLMVVPVIDAELRASESALISAMVAAYEVGRYHVRADQGIVREEAVPPEDDVRKATLRAISDLYFGQVGTVTLDSAEITGALLECYGAGWAREQREQSN